MARSRSRRPAPLDPPAPPRGVTVLAWPFPLLGNPGGDESAIVLQDALEQSLSEHADEAESRLMPVAAAAEFARIEFPGPEDLAPWRAGLRAAFEEIRGAGRLPVVIGSNHLVALPVLDAYAALPQSVCVVQFDAHLDAYGLARSREPLHHGNFLLHTNPTPLGLRPAGAPGKRRAGLSIVNVGHRDATLSRRRTEEHFERTWGAVEVAARPLAETVAEVAAHARRFDLVHIDIDADAIDPGALRAVGTPMPCGLAGREVLAICDALPQEKIAGVTISEYAEARDDDASGRHLLVFLLERILLRRHEALGESLR